MSDVFLKDVCIIADVCNRSRSKYWLSTISLLLLQSERRKCEADIIAERKKQVDNVAATGVSDAEVVI